MRLQNFAKALILAARQEKRSIDRTGDGVCTSPYAPRAFSDRHDEMQGVM